MALDGELNGGLTAECVDCKTTMEIEVYRSAAGYYIGFFCPEDGPYSRESDYFPTRAAAEAELAMWKEVDVRPSGRETGFHGGGE